MTESDLHLRWPTTARILMLHRLEDEQEAQRLALDAETVRRIGDPETWRVTP